MLPSNMSLHHWGVKDDVPNHLVGVYDIVNVRHFVFVLQEPEFKRVIDRLIRLLDIDANSLRLEKIRPEIEADAQLKLMEPFRGKDARLHTIWVPNLPALFAEGGLIEVATDVRESPPHLALPTYECGMLSVGVLVRKKEADEEHIAMIRRTLNQAVKETRDGSHLVFTRYDVVGRKKQVSV